MTIKRALFALIALMLMPAVALAQEPPPITPSVGTANIAVVKAFTTGNDEDTVMVTLNCDNGTYAPDTVELGNGDGHVFVIDNLGQNTATCTVTETVPADYDAGYLCFPGSAGGDDSCANPDIPYGSDPCLFNDVNAYFDGDVEDSVGYCIVSNTPSPVDVDVHKVWEVMGAAQADFDPDVLITLSCESPIVDFDYWNGGSVWRKTVTLRDINGDFDDEDGEYTGMATAEFGVYPNWFTTADDPDDQEYTECYAWESHNGGSAVEVDNDCGDIEVGVGMGDECTITNTVFFEGIPTLNQYGMAIMVLLMLGVGFVGFRRFV